MGVNNITLLGNMGKDPERRETSNGMIIASFSVGVGEVIKGERVTTWFNCTAFGSRAEYILRSCQKGSGVFVEGPHRKEVYNDKERWTVMVNNIVVYNGRKPGNDHGKD
jgi:single-strand DNA-binding protein